MDKLIGGHDEVDGHDESEALTERRPIVVTPDCRVSSPLASPSNDLSTPSVTNQ